MEVIKKWLESSGSYHDGVALIGKFSKNKILYGYLNRRVDMPKLRYELGKIAGKGATQATLIKPLAESPAEDLVVDPEFKVEPSGRITYEDLPSELRPCFESATEAYRNGRRCHYLLKDADTDGKRKGLRTELLKWIDQSRKSWQILDNWKETGEMPAAAKSEDKKIVNLSSAATSLTRQLEKLDKATSEDAIAQITPVVKSLVKTITENGRTISAKTKERLLKHNIEI